MKHYLNYTDFITLCNTNNFPIHFNEYVDGDDKRYDLYTVDGVDEHCCEINNIGATISFDDFEANYKATANDAFEKLDPNTRQLIVKPRPVEASLRLVYLYVTLGTAIDCSICTDWSIDTSTPGTTLVNYLPSTGYYVEGGTITLIDDTTNADIKLDCIVAPDYPFAKVFAMNKKLKPGILQQAEIVTSPSYIKYYNIYPGANKFQIKIAHDIADVGKEIEIGIRVYIE